ncbi:hypothetical protein [Saliphagus infecundisoli]|uniref:DUF7837 family putative zinc-binding protein n=1 Tax=Saliphagus infecundisoli TaxID=1849069 RepID=UPI001CD7CA42|nr:hypothetical protein [Saliphagus infecundisoli]
MATNETHALGSCPRCSTEIKPLHVLIEYESTPGEQNMFAECPACQEVVTPTPTP